LLLQKYQMNLSYLKYLMNQMNLLVPDEPIAATEVPDEPLVPDEPEAT
jgi:hypothetical protein